MQDELASLRAVGEKARRWGKSLWMSEQDFFVATSRLRQALPKYVQAQPALLDNGMAIVRAIDEIEFCVESSGLRLLGNVLVNAQEFEARLKTLENLFGCSPQRKAAGSGSPFDSRNPWS